MAIDSLSGNTMSKLTIKSPRLAGSLGLGRPFPTTRLTVEGLMTSSWRFKANRSPPNSGTETCDPHKAWKEKKIIGQKKSSTKSKFIKFVKRIHQKKSSKNSDTEGCDLHKAYNEKKNNSNLVDI